MNNIFLIVALVSGFFIAGAVLIFFAVRSNRSSDTTSRLTEFVSFQSRTKTTISQPAPEQQHFSEFFLQRTLLASFKKLLAFLGKFTPKQSIENTDRKLAIIRNPSNMRSREFFALRLVFLVIGIGVAILINLRNFAQIGRLISLQQAGTGSLMTQIQTPSILMVYIGLVTIILFFLFPIAWLDSEVRKVKFKVEREFPDALDLLSVCSDAGLGFDQALQRVGEYMQNTVGAEFRRVSSEMEVGVSRADSLRNMSERLQVSELSSFVTVIIQSEMLGMRIADVLHSQAEQFRLIRQFKAKEIAYRLPTKMVIPLALLILPALLIVLLGPLIPKIFNLLSM